MLYSVESWEKSPAKNLMKIAQQRLSEKGRFAGRAEGPRAWLQDMLAEVQQTALQEAITTLPQLPDAIILLKVRGILNYSAQLQ